MRIEEPRGEVEMRGEAHWLRCAFEDTALVADAVVTLAKEDEPAAGLPAVNAAPFAGLAVDRHCRIFHPLRELGAVEYLLWGRQTALRVVPDVPERFEIDGLEDAFGNPGPLPRVPIALACDESGYLYLADADPLAPALWIVDAWQKEVARRVDLPAMPLDVAHRDGKTYVLLSRAIGACVVLDACSDPQQMQWPTAAIGAGRLEVTLDERCFVRRYVIRDPGEAGARFFGLDDGISHPVPFCTDFLPPEDGGWIFARRPGEAFLQIRFDGGTAIEERGLDAPHYAGDGIVRTPDGRVAYWTGRGIRHAALARERFVTRGTVVGFALDGRHDRNEWGRVLLEACIPPGTRVWIRCHTRDDLEYADAITRTKPSNHEDLTGIAKPEMTPLPASGWRVPAAGWQQIFRDDYPGPVAASAPEHFAHYDAPVLAPPGRFLWIELLLEGTRSRTPRVRWIRVEYPRHGLLRQLPRTLWRDSSAADFLGRYLMPIAATLEEWGSFAGERHRLIDPRIAPSEALEWLGSWLGLAMDRCWPVEARRAMLSEASALFRIRGTVGAIRRMVEILTGAHVEVVEHFRLRGGGVAGNEEARTSRSVLGTGYRVGGPIGAGGDATIADGDAPAFDDFAHRFTVMVAAALSDEQMRCLRKLLETHKPAHTMFGLCAVETGVRVGVGLHAGLGAAIGRGSGFDPLVLSDAVLGKGYLLGRAELERGGEGSAWS